MSLASRLQLTMTPVRGLQAPTDTTKLLIIQIVISDCVLCW